MSFFSILEVKARTPSPIIIIITTITTFYLKIGFRQLPRLALNLQCNLGWPGTCGHSACLPSSWDWGLF